MCEHDDGLEWVGDDDGPIYACVMCGEHDDGGEL